jgi:hypothetical protein
VAALAGRERQARERTVIVVLSDGAPCDGAAVISVALTGGLSDIQADMYGIDNVVEWTGDWDSLARDIATVIAAQ